jgi:hypothetical protein
MRVERSLGREADLALELLERSGTRIGSAVGEAAVKSCRVLTRLRSDGSRDHGE